MRNLVLALLAVVVVAVVALLCVAALRPDQMHVERSIDIAAPPAAVFAIVNDFHRFPEWSPWQGLDPAMKTDLSGPPSGHGAAYHWAGNDKAGEGRMTIDESAPYTHIGIRLEFIKPFASTNLSAWEFTPTATGTHVTWSFDGKSEFMMKVMGVFMDMDKAIGGEYAKGLGNLKRLAEGPPASAAPADSSDAMVTPAEN
jgi:uncharacterized protein YndB with AHSA1/START domain